MTDHPPRESAANVQDRLARQTEKAPPRLPLHVRCLVGHLRACAKIDAARLANIGLDCTKEETASWHSAEFIIALFIEISALIGSINTAHTVFETAADEEAALATLEKIAALLAPREDDFDGPLSGAFEIEQGSPDITDHPPRENAQYILARLRRAAAHEVENHAYHGHRYAHKDTLPGQAADFIQALENAVVDYIKSLTPADITFKTRAERQTSEDRLDKLLTVVACYD